MKREYLEAIIEALGESEPAAIVAILRETDPEDYGVEHIKTAEHECELFVVRDSMENKPLWIVDVTGGGDTVYMPDYWADAVQDYAQEHGWDADEIPHIATGYERAGAHDATGMQYEPSQAQRIDADAEQFQCNLWREIRGLIVAPVRGE